MVFFFIFAFNKQIKKNKMKYIFSLDKYLYLDKYIFRIKENSTY